MELRYGTVVAALLFVPLVFALPAGSAPGPSTPPGTAKDLSRHSGPGSWGSWPPPYEDEEDDEDGFLGPRALPLVQRPAESLLEDDADAEERLASSPTDVTPKNLDDDVSPSEASATKDSEAESALRTEYARDEPANSDIAADSDVPEVKSAADEQSASKLVTTRDVQNVPTMVSNSTVLDAILSSQLKNLGTLTNSSSSSTRESKSFSSSILTSAVPPVKPLKMEVSRSYADMVEKTANTRERTAISAGTADVDAGSVKSTAAPSEAERDSKQGKQPSGGARAETAPQSDSSKTTSNSSQVDYVPSSPDSSSQQPAEVYVTAAADGVPDTAVDVSSSPPEDDAGWTAYDSSAVADDMDAGQQEEAVPQPDLRSRTAEREAAEEEEAEPAADAPVSRGRVAPATQPDASMDAASITGIALGIVVFASLVGTISFVMYRRRYLNKPQTLNDKCSNPDSSGYIDDSTLRENSEEMYSLDNDSFLNSLEAMTIQNYWTDNVKHTKL